MSDADAFGPCLSRACEAGDVAALVLRLAPADERTLVERVKRLAPLAQAREIAVLVASSAPVDLVDLGAVAIRGGADGVQADAVSSLPALRRRLGADRMLGAGRLLSRHDAMAAGEAEVDVVLFGEVRPDGTVPTPDAVAERAGWWAEIFETPCVAVAPTLALVPAMMRTGAEFVGLEASAWAVAEVADAVRDALRQLSGVPEGIA